MNTMNVDNNIMTWRPPLIRLTMIPNPDVDGGAPTPCYVAPDLIFSIARRRLPWPTASTYGFAREYHPAQPCTEVGYSGGPSFLVEESPQQVAALRDVALGHGPPAEPGTTLRQV